MGDFTWSRKGLSESAADWYSEGEYVSGIKILYAVKNGSTWHVSDSENVTEGFVRGTGKNRDAAATDFLNKMTEAETATIPETEEPVKPKTSKGKGKSAKTDPSVKIARKAMNKAKKEPVKGFVLDESPEPEVTHPMGELALTPEERSSRMEKVRKAQREAFRSDDKDRKAKDKTAKSSKGADKAQAPVAASELPATEDVPTAVVRYAAQRIRDAWKQSGAQCSAAQTRKLGRQEAADKITELRSSVAQAAEESGSESVKHLAECGVRLMERHAVLAKGGQSEIQKREADKLRGWFKSRAAQLMSV